MLDGLWASVGALDVLLRIGPAEQLALIVLVLTTIVALTPGAIAQAAGMAVCGLLMGTVWGTEVTSGEPRTWLGLNFNGDLPLPALMLVFGFLLPRLSAYAQQPQTGTRQRWSSMAYEGLLMYETLPALLLMRQPWWPSRWVVPLMAAWGVALGVFFGLTVADGWLCLGMAGVGMLAQRLGAPWPPAIVAVGVSGLLEENLRRSLLLSGGEWGPVLTRPLCAAMLSLAVVVVLASVVVRRRRGARRDSKRPTDLTAG